MTEATYAQIALEPRNEVARRVTSGTDFVMNSQLSSTRECRRDSAAVHLDRLGRTHASSGQCP
jgi:hypothetical protein